MGKQIFSNNNWKRRSRKKFRAVSSKVFFYHFNLFIQLNEQKQLRNTSELARIIYRVIILLSIT